MTFEQKGAYMELLMTQFNRGHMTSHMIGQVLGHNSGQIWEVLKDKFHIDSDGRYYNVRLEQEQIKRKLFTASRNKNIKGVNQYTKKGNNNDGHMDGHVTSHMENENRNEYELLDYNTIINILYKEEILHEEIMMKHKLSKDDLFSYIRLFISNQKIEKPGKRTLVDIRKHFNNWIRIQMEKNPIRTDKPGRKVYKGEQDIINEREERRKQWEREHNQ